MSNILKVKCGDKEITIKIQRPSFESVKKGYEEITKIGREEGENEGAKHLYMTGNVAEANLVNNIVSAEKRYEMIGGQAYREFMNNKINLYNTCALRVSYALNYSTHPIKDMEKQNSGRAYNGNDGHIYYLGVPDIVELLNKNWKALSWDKSTYSQVKDKIRRGCSEDFYKGMTSKMENIHFFEELQSIQRKGIIAMNGTDDLRHTTLWNGSDFLDTYLELSPNYLTEPECTVRDLYFWDLL